jgi:hypothetical protein
VVVPHGLSARAALYRLGGERNPSTTVKIPSG